MTTQFDHLVEDALRQRLQQQDFSAEVELAERFNKTRSREKQIALPAEGTPYHQYPLRLLALLWSLAGNRTALKALTQQGGLPYATDYSKMGTSLLTLLWTFSHDADALEALWRREGRLPVERITADTPAGVLGFLTWSQRRPDALEELFRRYHQGQATDRAQERACKLLELVKSWDFLNYPEFSSLLNVSTYNHWRDLNRRNSHEPPAASDQPQVANPTDTFNPGPDDEYTLQDHRRSLKKSIENLVPIEIRIIYKAKENTEDQPQELTAEELDHAARKNLMLPPGGPVKCVHELAREKARLRAWMALHPAPTGKQLAECFPWYDPSRFGTATRLWRLRTAADENNQLLTRLAPGGTGEAADLAEQMQEVMDELVHTVSPGRKKGEAGAGPVPTFRRFQDAARRLWHRLGEQTLDEVRAGALARCRANYEWFCGEFPTLVKLASCLRLVPHLETPGRLPAVGKLKDDLGRWLENGAWLSTFSGEAKSKSRQFHQKLTGLHGRFQGRSEAAGLLLELWLGSTQTSGLPEQRLIDLDRAWFLSHDRVSYGPAGLAERADALVARAYRLEWAEGAREASAMLHLLPPAGAAGSALHELRDCLHHLSSGGQRKPRPR